LLIDNKKYKERSALINMGFGSDEYIDYTLLKKKGILKLPEEKKLPIKAEGGFVDFTAFGTPETARAAPAQEAPAPNFDFLSNMAGAGSSNNSQTETTNPLANFDVIQPFQPATSTSQLTGSVDAKEMNALKIKIDDMDYKINNFIEKLDKIEEKLGRLNLG
jgi:hypothetical protein